MVGKVCESLECLVTLYVAVRVCVCVGGGEGREGREVGGGEVGEEKGGVGRWDMEGEGREVEGDGGMERQPSR